MNENLALIISGISIVGGLGSFVFFQHKTKKDLFDKTNKIYELENSLNNIKNLAKEEILKVTNENKSLKSENEQIKDQLSISQAEIFSLQEENELNKINQNVQDTNQVIEILEKLDNMEDIKEPLSILFVDDSPVIRVTMKKFLKDENYDLTLVNDGLEALSILSEKKFDLIITDLEMPNLDGFELMSKLLGNDNTKDIPVIVLTGHDEVSVKIENSSSLMGLYKKPWNEVELLKRIKLLSNLKN
jgi:CheY-like chemotaxis protein